MKTIRLFRWMRAYALLLTIVMAPALRAQEGPPDFVRRAVRDVEQMLDSKGEKPVERFIEQSMVPASDQDKRELVKVLAEIRSELRGLRDDMMVEEDPDGVRLILAGGQVVKQLKISLDFEKEAISGLTLMEGPETMDLNVDHLQQTFDQLEEEGLAGVAHVKIDGEVLVEKGFGYSNRELGHMNNLETIFGVGSRPIDFTMAAILLVDQQGAIDLDDPIHKYFPEVPQDKQTITIRHLMSGRSGLPDFFHTPEDWDPDLAWIDRETAVMRILHQELIFEPGKGRRHSHGAFGLLAALVEEVSGTGYYDFIREYFLDPAGMERTGEYGESRGLQLSDFAVGGGPQQVGLPNIPPNWGPTSWLIKGSGGMYSTMGDLQKLYRYIRSGQVLDEEHRRAFLGPSINLDGSMRGFELFSAYIPPDTEIYLFLNEMGDREKTRQLFRALERLAEPAVQE